MAGKKGGENSKKSAGQARKAEAAAEKKAAKDREADAVETAEWQKGAKDNSKKESEATKAAEAARRKAERQALEAEEVASLPTKARSGNARTAQKKTRGLDLSQLDDAASSSSFAVATNTLNASGIDNALDALEITSDSRDNIDRHPERRFKAAYTAFETRRLEEMKDDKTLRRQQKIEVIRKEFEKSPENPFNQVSGNYNSTRQELEEIKRGEKDKVEARLTGAS